MDLNMLIMVALPRSREKFYASENACILLVMDSIKLTESPKIHNTWSNGFLQQWQCEFELNTHRNTAWSVVWTVCSLWFTEEVVHKYPSTIKYDDCPCGAQTQLYTPQAERVYWLPHGSRERPKE